MAFTLHFPSEMDTINTEIGLLASKIDKTEEQVADVKGALQGSGTYLGITDRGQLLERLGALAEQIRQLRKEKEQLREENFVYSLLNRLQLLQACPRKYAQSFAGGT